MNKKGGGGGHYESECYKEIQTAESYLCRIQVLTSK